MKILAFVVMFSGLLFYFLTTEERVKLLRACRALGERAAREAVRRWTRQPDDAGERPEPIAFATWTVATLNLWVFARMFLGDAPFGDPRTVVAWGGSFGPRTTNGEWWRLVTATFVHASPLHALATLAGLIQIGCIAERLVGRLAFASIYVTAGTLATLVCLSRSPVSLVCGGGGAVLAIYGLLTATWLWGMLRGSPVRLGWQTAKRVAPGVAFFILYTVATGRLDRVVVAVALAAGAISGFLLAKGANDHKPAVRRVLVLSADTLALIMLFAVPLRGMADVTPEIRRIVETEDRTARRYDATVVRFNSGAVPSTLLVDLIERMILPEMQAARARLEGLERVPRDDQPLITRAMQYLDFREESWRLRSRALRQSRAPLLKEADRAEWRALDALNQIREAGQRRLEH